MLISNNVPSQTKWCIKRSVLSLYSGFDCFPASPPLLWWDAIPSAAPVSHYGCWWLGNRLLSALWPPLSLSLSPFSYCQHTFTSNCSGCAHPLPLAHPTTCHSHDATAPFLLSLLPTQERVHEHANDFVTWLACFIDLQIAPHSFSHIELPSK